MNQPWTNPHRGRASAGQLAAAVQRRENIIVEAMGRLGWVRPKSYPEWSGKRRPSWVEGTFEEPASGGYHRVRKS